MKNAVPIFYLNVFYTFLSFIMQTALTAMNPSVAVTINVCVILRKRSVLFALCIVFMQFNNLSIYLNSLSR